MYRMIVQYTHPADPDKFLAYYRDVHAPLAAGLPGLVSLDWVACETLDGSPAPHFLIATLTWNSKADALAALGSPQGKATTADLANFTDPATVEVDFGEVNPG